MGNKYYGKEKIESFDIEKDLEVWPSKHEKTYLIKVKLPEFMCLCPLSGYPDFAILYLEYAPRDLVVELKALKLFVNSFKDKHISHEDSINQIYDILHKKINPKYMKLVGKFNPRGNVSTKIEINSEDTEKYQ